MKLSQGLFKIAKSPLGDFIIGIAFQNLSSILPVKRIKENDKVIAFWHPKPFWEHHILIVPKKKIKNIKSITPDDLPYIAAVFECAKEIVSDLSWDKEGYTILANGGDRQEVNQIHFHLWKGEELNSTT